MVKFIVKRCLMVIPVLLGATFLVFSIMEMTSGDPARIILGDTAPEEQVQQLRKELRLDDPFAVRYINFIVNLLHGDMGTSYRNGLDVSKQIQQRLSKTIILASSAVLIALVIGIPCGVFSAIRHYSLFDNVVSVLSLIMAAAPVFWLGLVAVQLFSLKLGWLPAATSLNKGFATAVKSLILPAFCLSGNTTAIVVRMTRASMLEVVNQDYIDTARAKGLPEKEIRTRHMLKNALIPIVTSVGLNFGALLGGSVLTESIFAWPGVGRFVVESINAKDTPCVLASVVVLAVLFTLINLLVDILYAFIDPRIKSQYQRAKRGRVL
jgi:peptide/nickel transport system permease protein